MQTGPRSAALAVSFLRWAKNYRAMALSRPLSYIDRRTMNVYERGDARWRLPGVFSGPVMATGEKEPGVSMKRCRERRMIGLWG